MENTKEKTYKILIDILKEFGEENELEELNEPSLSTNLYGTQGVLDSLALVRLIVEMEEMINEEFDKDITLADEKAMSQERSPFRSVESLVDYTVNLIKEEN